MVTFQPFIGWQWLDLIKPIAIPSTTMENWRRKNILHSNVEEFTITIAIFMSQHQRWQDENGSRTMPCLSINFGKMRMVWGLCHGRPVGGDWLRSEASPTTTLVKLAWDVEKYYYYYLATCLTTKASLRCRKLLLLPLFGYLLNNWGLSYYYISKVSLRCRKLLILLLLYGHLLNN